ncbi:MAG TPA: stage II sporulation protein M [Candidatus Nanoarchaeia archaeon]|nr:stage II sporulation protein M [Candidatus Nanoarchaeia archaeon]
MVFERLFSADWVERRPTYSLLLGVVFTLIGFGTSMALFHPSGLDHLVGISTILFTVIITIPGIVNLFNIEEEIETEETGSYFKNFFKEHEGVIDFHLYFFVGAFVVLFVISMISPELVFSQERLYNLPLEQSEQGAEIIVDSSQLPPLLSPITMRETVSIMLNNMYVMLLAFILSLFYGSGALFLITLNASVFASSLARVVTADIIHGTALTAGLIASCHLSIMFLHGIPEVLSYFLAAIAGGVLSKAFVQEHFMSWGFKRVLTDGLILMTAALLVVAFSAVIEVMISKRLFFSRVCTAVVVPAVIIGAVVFFGLAYLEFHRKYKL